MRTPQTKLKAIPKGKTDHWSLDWKQIPIKNNDDDPLICIENLHPHIVSRPYYFDQNIKGSLTKCYMRQTVFEKCIQAVTLLRSIYANYALVIYDAWRPTCVQHALFDQFKAETKKNNPTLSDAECIKKTATFVSIPNTDPRCPSPHLTGASVDLTIVNQYKTPLDMGTVFDDFTEKAHTDYYELNASDQYQDIRHNRRLLYHIMTSVGFSNYPYEWWHFDYGNQFWAQSTSSSLAHYSAVTI